MSINSEERYSRQADLVPIDKLDELIVTIIGVGAIGRQVALQLTAMGVPDIQIIDFDIVEEGNLASQGFLETDLNKPKVTAVTEMCKQINSSVNLSTINNKFQRKTNIGDIIFCCVDKIDTRKFIWEVIQKNQTYKLFLDSRMAAETMRIILASNKISKEYYPTTFFTAEEAFTGSCTAKSTIYSSNVTAGLMIAQFVKYLREMPLDIDFQVNLLTNEISVKTDQEINQSLYDARNL